MLYGEEVAVCSEKNTKHTKCGQNIQFVDVKPVDASRNEYALKG